MRIDENPWRCPRCRSIEVTYLHDAAVQFRQTELESGKTGVEQNGLYTYDNVIEATCRSCNFEEERPSPEEWGD